MSRAVVVVWLGSAALRADHEPDLASWAESRLVALEEPRDRSALPPAGHDDAHAESLEALLSDTRTAAFGGDPAARSASLDALEGAIEAHPELPQAAWLLAEAFRLRAAVVAREEPERARGLETAAAELDGHLAPAFGSSTAPSDAGGADAAAARATYALRGPLPGDRVYVDGREARAVGPGKHHVRVLRRGALAWAGWVTGHAGDVHVPVPVVAPCSAEELEAVSLDGARVVAPGVACPDWIAVRRAGDGRIEVARCARASCGSLLPWSRRWGTPIEGPAQPEWPPPPDRTWVHWVLGGVVAATATGAVLWRTGAFERRGASRDTFVFVPPER